MGGRNKGDRKHAKDPLIEWGIMAGKPNDLADERRGFGAQRSPRNGKVNGIEHMALTHAN